VLKLAAFLLLAGPQPSPEMVKSDQCIETRCYCSTKTDPRVCFCAQPDPKDGTVYIFTPKIRVTQVDGGAQEFAP
jgi:hypothetical protein